MLRVRLIAAISAAAIAGIALAGCSSTSTPDWLKPAPPPPQALQFESEPPGATVQLSQGQTCRTPCSLTVPVVAQSVMFTMNGYLTQTVPVTVHEPEHSWFNSKPPDLLPNPVTVQLQPAPPPPRPVKPKPRRIARPKPTPARAMPASAPVPASPQDSAFPPPPPMQSPASSPFPPPPTR